jgi:hypothetical protein
LLNSLNWFVPYQDYSYVYPNLIEFVDKKEKKNKVSLKHHLVPMVDFDLKIKKCQSSDISRIFYLLNER